MLHYNAITARVHCNWNGGYKLEVDYGLGTQIT